MNSSRSECKGPVDIVGQKDFSLILPEENTQTDSSVQNNTLIGSEREKSALKTHLTFFRANRRQLIFNPSLLQSPLIDVTEHTNIG